MRSLFAFQLDPFQERALAALGRGSSVLVAAPTGVGKTVIAEMAIDRALSRGQAALYASPLKALSNQKYRDMCARYGSGRVGILTGDTQVNPTAPVLVLTAEILHNRLLSGQLGGLANVSCLVFDEFHYLSDRERGSVWEETIILCPRHIQVVCLSATLPNVAEVAGWMEQQTGAVEVVVETQRPVPLTHHYFAAGQLHPAISGNGEPDRTLKRYDARPGTRSASIVDLLPALLREQLTPALSFVFSRRDAERSAAMAAAWMSEQAPLPRDAEGLLAARLASVDPSGPGSSLAQCIRAGVAFHHAGMPAELKELVEELFGEGLLRLLCATETFALGLNMPARTVVLPRITKFDGRGHRELTAREFQQMAGRAGRRGKDDRGHVVLVADPWVPFSRVARLLAAPLEAVQSAFSLSYPTLLNATAVYGDAAAEALVTHSFMLYQLGAEVAGAEAQLTQLEGQAAQPGSMGSRKLLTDGRRRVAALRAALAAGAQRRELEVMRSALDELGFSGGSAKTRLARGIFDPGALLIAELLADARLDPASLDPVEFAEMAGWFAARDRRHAPRGGSIKLGTRARQLRQLLEDVTARIHRAERHGGVLVTQAVVPAFPNLISRWCGGEEMRLLGRDYQLGEGDVAAYVERTQQLLRQIARATSAVPEFEALSALAVAALDKVTSAATQAGGELTA